MKIVDIRCHVLLDPGFDPEATSSAQDAIVVEIETDEGIVGVGETDLNAWIARACIEAPGTHTMDQGIKPLLLGCDPLDPVGLWRKLYVGTAMTGRRGALIHAMGAVDMALWDIRGKAEGVPCWQLWGEPAVEVLTPYASLQPDVSSIDAYTDTIVTWAQRAVNAGFCAVKLEATFDGPYRHRGLKAEDAAVTEIVAAVRSTVGPSVRILVDVQYALDSVERAVRLTSEWADLDVYFLEAPLWPDGLDAYAELVAASPVPIASGEWLATEFEFRELAERGNVQFLQPDIGRVGGFTQALRVCELASDLGKQVVPHVWKTGISTAAAAHLATVTPHMPLFEFLPPELCTSRLRRELVTEELTLHEGVLYPPRRPGLGVDIVPEALEEFEAAAVRLNEQRGPT
jgi:L-alanine-DL-glutamate epimerase-like enolase superfamily enzyme